MAPGASIPRGPRRNDRIWTGKAPGRRLQFVPKYHAFDPNSTRAADGLRAATLAINDSIRADDVKVQLDWLRPPAGRRVLARIQTNF